MLVLIFYLIYFQSGVCTHKFTFDGRVMCLHAAFDLLFVGLNTGIVASIDLVVSSGIRSMWVRALHASARGWNAVTIIIS